MSDAWKQWEGHVVDGLFPLREFQGNTDHSAVFVTSVGSLQEKAALKLMPVPAGGEQAALKRWERARNLSHPHLLRLFAFGTCTLSATSFLYVVSEFAEENLGQILPNRPLSPQETEFMLRSALEVLGYLHGASLVHAGLKPANLMAVGDDLKLSSESICVTGDRTAILRAPGPYDAPELAASGPSPATDVWSLGVTLVESLTQKVSPGAAFREGDPVLPAGTLGNFLEITRQCLRLDPQRRWTTQEIAARLLPSPQPVRPRSAYVPAAVAVVALAGILAAGKLFWHQPVPKKIPDPRPPAGFSEARPPRPDPAKEKPAPPSAGPPKQDLATAAAKSPASRAPEPVAKTIPGAVLEKVVPNVSRRSLNTITGRLRVSVKLDVDSSGRVTETALASPGPSQYFARAARESARVWKFTPPVKQGEAVASEWVLRFVFTRNGVDVEPVQLSP